MVRKVSICTNSDICRVTVAPLASLTAVLTIFQPFCSFVLFHGLKQSFFSNSTSLNGITQTSTSTSTSPTTTSATSSLTSTQFIEEDSCFYLEDWCSATNWLNVVEVENIKDPYRLETVGRDRSKNSSKFKIAIFCPKNEYIRSGI